MVETLDPAFGHEADHAARLRAELDLLLPMEPPPLPAAWAAARSATLREVEMRLRAAQERLRNACASPRTASAAKWLACGPPAALLARILLERLWEHVGLPRHGSATPPADQDGAPEASESAQEQEQESVCAAGDDSSTPDMAPVRFWRPVGSFASEAIALGEVVGALCRIGRLAEELGDAELRATTLAQLHDLRFPVDPLDPFWSPAQHYRIGALLLGAILPLRVNDRAPADHPPFCRVWMPGEGEASFAAAPLGCIAVLEDDAARGKARKMILLSPPARRLARRTRSRRGSALLPLPLPPLDWRDRGLPPQALRGEQLDRPGHYRYCGGYLALRRPLIRADAQIMTEGLDNPCGGIVFDTVNALQRVAFRVDHELVAVVRRALTLTRDSLAKAGPAERQTLHPFASLLGLDPRKDASLDRPGRLALFERLSDQERTLDRLEQLATYPNGFFQVYRIDYRGRLYPDSVVSHQGNAILRACIRFRHGSALGPYGLQWLKVHVARLSGQLEPTASEAEAVAWTDQHLPILLMLGRPDFLLSRRVQYRAFRFLCAARPKKRLRFLAACRALHAAAQAPRPEAHLCDLPIYLDGSANILQHFALLTRDRRLAHDLCNLNPVRLMAPEETRVVSGLPVMVRNIPRSESRLTDPYGVIGQRAHERIRDSLDSVAALDYASRLSDWFDGRNVNGQEAGSASMVPLGLAALAWSGDTPFGVKPDAVARLLLAEKETARKVVKTVLVRRLYGGTSFGVVEALSSEFPQIAEAARVVAIDCTASFAARAEPTEPRTTLEKRLAWHILASISDEIWASFVDLAPASAALLEALRHVAEEAARNQLPLRWTTPASLFVQFAPRKATTGKLTTGRGGISSKLSAVTPASPLDGRRMINGVAANVVHSLDAAHAMITVAMADHAGEIPVMPIHDAFGTRVGDVEVFVRLLQRGLFRLYEFTDAETLLRDLIVQSGIAPLNGTTDRRCVSPSELAWDAAQAKAERVLKPGGGLAVVRLADIPASQRDAVSQKVVDLCAARQLSLGDLDVSDVLSARHAFS